MSWDPRSAGPSPTPEPLRDDPALAALVRLRGEPLLNALEQRSPEAREHAEATGTYAFAAAAQLGLGRSGAELCRETARLHDIGKLYAAAELLAREGELTGEEKARLDSHHEAGAKLALGAGIPDDVCGWILQARERFDGGGPDGLAGESIPIASRIARATCFCDRLLMGTATADAGPRRRKALDALRGAAGRELDPRVVDALASVLAAAESPPSRAP